MKNYTVNEIAIKANCSTSFIYELAREEKIQKVMGKEGIIKIPSTELSKIIEIKEKTLCFNPEKVEIKETSFGMVRKLKFSDEYVAKDIVRAEGIEKIEALIECADENEKRKIEGIEGKELRLRTNSKGIMVVSSNAIKKYSQVSKSLINWDKFLEEMGIVEKESTHLESKPAPVNNVFEGTAVEIIEVNGELLFEIYSTGMALGYVTINSKGKSYPHKVRINQTIENAEISACVHGVHKYFAESQLYDFMLEAKTDKCKKFKKWLTNIVLPNINRYGGHIENVDKAVNSYFPNISQEFKDMLKAGIVKKNNEIQANINRLQIEMDSNSMLLKNLIRDNGSDEYV